MRISLPSARLIEVYSIIDIHVLYYRVFILPYTQRPTPINIANTIKPAKRGATIFMKKIIISIIITSAIIPMIIVLRVDEVPIVRYLT